MIVGDSKRFDYTGNKQSVELNPGIYKLEYYGARGGNGYGNSAGGKGRYNSNLYKDSYHQEHFDFNKLLEV